MNKCPFTAQQLYNEDWPDEGVDIKEVDRELLEVDDHGEASYKQIFQIGDEFWAIYWRRHPEYGTEEDSIYGPDKVIKKTVTTVTYEAVK